MKSYDLALCEAIGRKRRAIAKLERKIKNSVAFHEARGSTDHPKWEAMVSELMTMRKDVARMTEKLKSHRANGEKP